MNRLWLTGKNHVARSKSEKEKSGWKILERERERKKNNLTERERERK